MLFFVDSCFSVTAECLSQGDPRYSPKQRVILLLHRGRETLARLYRLQPVAIPKVVQVTDRSMFSSKRPKNLTQAPTSASTDPKKRHCKEVAYVPVERSIYAHGRSKNVSKSATGLRGEDLKNFILAPKLSMQGKVKIAEFISLRVGYEVLPILLDRLFRNCMVLDSGMVLVAIYIARIMNLRETRDKIQCLGLKVTEMLIICMLLAEKYLEDAALTIKAVLHSDPKLLKQVKPNSKTRELEAMTPQTLIQREREVLKVMDYNLYVDVSEFDAYVTMFQESSIR
jgi:hypothetical protein